MLRRLVLHREVAPALQFPGANWVDIQQILYGAGGDNSALFPGEVWGGMSADIAVFLQTALNLPEYLASDNEEGKWRIFSKLGCGFSSSRHKAEIVTNSYGCLPTYSSSSAAAVGGVELSLTVRGSVPDNMGLTVVENKVMDAVNKAVAYALKDAGMMQ